jgi:hypothetical protein
MKNNRFTPLCCLAVLALLGAGCNIQDLSKANGNYVPISGKCKDAASVTIYPEFGRVEVTPYATVSFINQGDHLDHCDNPVTFCIYTRARIDGLSVIQEEQYHDMIADHANDWRAKVRIDFSQSGQMSVTDDNGQCIFQKQ